MGFCGLFWLRLGKMCSLRAFPRGRFFPLLLVFCARCTFSLARKYQRAPGGIAKAAIPPDPVGVPCGRESGCIRGGSGCRGLLELSALRTQSSAKSPHGVFWRSRCSRWGLRGRYLAFPSGEGGFGRSPKTDEVSPSSRHPPLLAILAQTPPISAKPRKNWFFAVFSPGKR